MENLHEVVAMDPAEVLPAATGRPAEEASRESDQRRQCAVFGIEHHAQAQHNATHSGQIKRVKGFLPAPAHFAEKARSG